jgi:hypothetical protein
MQGRPLLPYELTDCTAGRQAATRDGVRVSNENQSVPKFTSTNSRPLVQWVSRATAPLARTIEPQSPIGAVATSIRGAAHLKATLAEAVKGGAGALIDTEAWRAQLEPEDPQRAGEFRRLGLDLDERSAFSPSAHRLSASGRNELVAAHRNIQVAGGATILISPYHYVGETAPLSSGRRLDIALAHEFSALAAASGARHGAPGGPPRSVAVAIAVNARSLTPAMIGELVAAYKEVQADLYWLWVWKFTSSAAQYRQVREFAVRLQGEAGTPCAVAGLGRLWEAALRNEVAAACQGWGRTRLPFPPPDPPEPKESKGEEEDDSGWGVHVLHPAIRGTTALGKEDEEPLRRLFAEEPCYCGHHEPNEVPEGARARHAHNRSLAEELTHSLTGVSPVEARVELAEIVARAVERRRQLELGSLERGWGAAVDTPLAEGRPALPADLWRRSA